MLDELYYDYPSGWKVIVWDPDGYTTERHALTDCPGEASLDRLCVYACDSRPLDNGLQLVTEIGKVIAGP